ncbi:MAG: hypothetical protein KA270_02260 [Saprospiraceae bacterium]|jgi:hypothetical protein|nr:hypothetical protein [Saprospiraceae bacterium]MBP6565958.1 hypothetical protein [Saprospiraceae bacterium]
MRSNRISGHTDSEKEVTNGFWDNSVVFFFLSPIIVFIVVCFTGNQIFYGNKNMSKKQVILLTAGLLCYIIIGIVVLS